MSLPLVSVLLPAYNAAPYLREAIDGIRAQTLADWELIVIDDGSTDGTPAILAGCDDPRLIVIRQANAGVSAALNAGLARARGRYLARQDADDISHPERLARLAAFLDAHPEIDLVGSTFTAIAPDGSELYTARLMTQPLAIRRFLLAGNCLFHPGVMIRAVRLRAMNGYRLDARHVEDYDLWIRLGPVPRLAALPLPLVRYRVHPDNVSARHAETMAANTREVRERAWRQASREPLRPLGGWREGFTASRRLRDSVAAAPDHGLWRAYHLAGLLQIVGQALGRGNFRLALQTTAETKGFFFGDPGAAVVLAGLFWRSLRRMGGIRQAWTEMRALLNGMRREK